MSEKFESTFGSLNKLDYCKVLEINKISKDGEETSTNIVEIDNQKEIEIDN